MSKRREVDCGLGDQSGDTKESQRVMWTGVCWAWSLRCSAKEWALLVSESYQSKEISHLTSKPWREHSQRALYLASNPQCLIDFPAQPPPTQKSCLTCSTRFSDLVLAQRVKHGDQFDTGRVEWHYGGSQGDPINLGKAEYFISLHTKKGHPNSLAIQPVESDWLNFSHVPVHWHRPQC